MDDAISKSEHRCGLCKKTFKQSTFFAAASSILSFFVQERIGIYLGQGIVNGIMQNRLSCATRRDARSSRHLVRDRRLARIASRLSRGVICSARHARAVNRAAFPARMCVLLAQ